MAVGADVSVGQNMVPNGNFEIYTGCPDNANQLYRSPFWDNPPNILTTTDYFHACEPLNILSTPQNGVGFQEPLNGMAYAGVTSYSKNFPHSREYAYTELRCPLDSGFTYKAGFFVSRAEASFYAIDRMGMYLGDTIDAMGGYNLTMYNPQVENPQNNFLIDTVSWMEITGTFEANGTERYLAIGNFADSAGTHLMNSLGLPSYTAAYYYIDSVYVIPLTPPPTVSISNDTVICAGGSVTLEAGNSGVYYWFEQGFPLDTLSYTNTLTASPDTTTVYELQTCTDLLRVKVEVRHPPTVSLGNDTLLCDGQSIVLDATAPNATYQWQDGSTDSTFTVTENGTYHVSITNQCGTASDTVNVFYLSPPSVNLGNDTLLCPSETLLLHAAADSATYVWQNGSPDSTFSVTQAGTYYMEATNQCGTDSDTVAVSYIAPPVVALGNDTLVCVGQTITLTASADTATYQWQDGSTDSTFTVTENGTYHVSITNQCGTASDTVNVFYLSPPSVNLGSDTLLCPSETLLLHAAADSATYVWQNGSPDSTFSVTQAGTYYMEATNQCGTDSDTITVSYIAPPTVVLGNDTLVCIGQTITLTASADTATYQWQDGSTDSTFTVTENGTYYVRITNQCGTASDTVNVFYLSPPSVNLGNDTLLCPSETLLLHAVADSATYLWQNGSTDSTFSVTQTGTYYMEATNQCGTDSDTITVSYIAPPTVALGNDTLVCVGQTITLTASADTATYQWQDGSTDSTFTVTENGTYHVTITNQCGTASDTVNVFYLSPPSVNHGNDTLLCPSETLLLHAAADSATYLWQNGSTDSTFSVTQAGTYYMEATNQCGTDSDTVAVSYIAPPTVALGNDTLVCVGQTITLTASADTATYQWQDSSTDSTFTVTENGIYHVTITNQCGIASDTVEVLYLSPPSVNLGNDTLLCPSETLLLTVSANSAIYTWQNGSTDSIFTVTQEGTYHVRVTNQCGTDRDTLTVSYISLPHVSIGSDTVICMGDTLVLIAVGEGLAFQWQDGSSDAFFTVTEEGIYWAMAPHPCGTVGDTVHISLLDCDTVPGPISVPNVFTPNGDGINDVFYIEELPLGSQLSIYNRWGRRIVFTENYANDWGADGFSEGTYFYVLSLPTGKGLKGYVTVIR